MAKSLGVGTFNVSIHAPGLERMLKNRRVIAMRAMHYAFAKEAESIMVVAKAIVPYDTGELMRTGKWYFEKLSPKTVSVVMKFGGDRAPYAVVQHENLQFRHLPGRTAKYLEKPFAAARPRIAARLERQLARELKIMGGTGR